jgi:hypothetical protein
MTLPIDEATLTLADRLWAAERAASRGEDELLDILQSILGDRWDDFTTDYYDRSIEIFGVPADFVLDDAGQLALREAGFHRAWTHVDDLRRSGGEKGERAYGLLPKESA